MSKDNRPIDLVLNFDCIQIRIFPVPHSIAIRTLVDFLTLVVKEHFVRSAGRGGVVSRRHEQRRLIVGYPPINPRNRSLPPAGSLLIETELLFIKDADARLPFVVGTRQRNCHIC